MPPGPRDGRGPSLHIPSAELQPLDDIFFFKFWASSFPVSTISHPLPALPLPCTRVPSSFSVSMFLSGGEFHVCLVPPFLQLLPGDTSISWPAGSHGTVTNGEIVTWLPRPGISKRKHPGVVFLGRRTRSLSSQLQPGAQVSN